VSVTLRYDAQRLSDDLRARVDRALTRAAVEVQMAARQLCSKPAKRITRRRKHNTSRGRKGSTYTEYVPSPPGSPPALRTGVGRSSITWWSVDATLKRVGIRSNGAYMIGHELGAGKLPRRPWLQPAVAQKRQAVQELIRRALA
jgi:hypothetical protein